MQIRLQRLVLSWEIVGFCREDMSRTTIFSRHHDLNLAGCNGRKIKFSKPGDSSGVIMARANNGTWYAKKLSFTYDASTTSLLQLILIGGNSGDVVMEIL